MRLLGYFTLMADHERRNGSKVAKTSEDARMRRRWQTIHHDRYLPFGMGRHCADLALDCPLLVG
jgi:hypothetical protein